VLHAGLLAHDADHFQATLCEFCVYVHAGKSVRELLYFLEFWWEDYCLCLICARRRISTLLRMCGHFRYQVAVLTCAFMIRHDLRTCIGFKA
jgi:hypothetical protein